jgi:hypothetical protein
MSGRAIVCCRGFINAFAMLGASGGAKAAGVIMLLIAFCFGAFAAGSMFMLIKVFNPYKSCISTQW